MSHYKKEALRCWATKYFSRAHPSLDYKKCILGNDSHTQVTEVNILFLFIATGKMLSF